MTDRLLNDLSMACTIANEHGPFNSLHEAYAVIAEELDELWEHVRKKSTERDYDEVRSELLQIAACALKATSVGPTSGHMQLRAAIDRSGFEVSQCRVCGQMVVCIPDGLPYCEPCGINAMKNQ